MKMPLYLISKAEARELMLHIEELGEPEQAAALSAIDKMEAEHTRTSDTLFQIFVLINDYRTGNIDLNSLKLSAIEILNEHGIIQRAE